MKPFNFDLAKQGKPVCTRDGRKARIVCFDAKDDNYPILALIDNTDYEDAEWYTADGKYCFDGESKDYDLMMVSEHHEGWVNLYGVFNKIQTGAVIYPTESEAVAHKGTCEGPDYITTVKVEWED